MSLLYVVVILSPSSEPFDPGTASDAAAYEQIRAFTTWPGQPRACWCEMVAESWWMMHRLRHDLRKCNVYGRENGFYKMRYPPERATIVVEGSTFTSAKHRMLTTIGYRNIGPRLLYEVVHLARVNT